jgi:hypothetical protein
MNQFLTRFDTYLVNGGTVENAQAIVAHESPRTTKLYDRRDDQISLNEIEKIVIKAAEHLKPPRNRESCKLRSLIAFLPPAQRGKRR